MVRTQKNTKRQTTRKILYDQFGGNLIPLASLHSTLSYLKRTDLVAPNKGDMSLVLKDDSQEYIKSKVLETILQKQAAPKVS